MLLKVADCTLVDCIYFNVIKMIKVCWALHECSITKHMQWQNLIFRTLSLSTNKSNSFRKWFSDSFWKLRCRCTYLSSKAKINNSTSFFCMRGWFSNHALKQNNNYIQLETEKNVLNSCYWLENQCQWLNQKNSYSTLKKKVAPTTWFQLNFHYLEQYIISVLVNFLCHRLLRSISSRTISVLLKD